jgi:hypothetical protein
VVPSDLGPARALAIGGLADQMPLLLGRGGASWQRQPGTEMVPAAMGFTVVGVVVLVVVKTHLLHRCSSPLGSDGSSRWVSSSLPSPIKLSHLRGNGVWPG